MDRGRRTGPLVFVSRDQLGHRLLECLADAKLVIEDDLAELINAALHGLEPARRPLKLVGGVNVVCTGEKTW
jgi:hypothetical protein